MKLNVFKITISGHKEGMLTNNMEEALNMVKKLLKQNPPHTVKIQRTKMDKYQFDNQNDFDGFY